MHHAHAAHTSQFIRDQFWKVEAVVCADPFVIMGECWSGLHLDEPKKVGSWLSMPQPGE